LLLVLLQLTIAKSANTEQQRRRWVRLAVAFSLKATATEEQACHRGVRREWGRDGDGRASERPHVTKPLTTSPID